VITRLRWWHVISSGLSKAVTSSYLCHHLSLKPDLDFDGIPTHKLYMLSKKQEETGRSVQKIEKRTCHLCYPATCIELILIRFLYRFSLLCFKAEVD